MARLPRPGQDNGTWGELLNDFLSASHNADGTLKEAAVSDSIPAASASSKGVIQLAGDLAGTADTPTVPGLSTKLDTTLVTSLGDLLAATGNGAITRLGVGGDGQVLTADSGESTGIKWTTSSSGAQSLTGDVTGSLSGSAIATTLAITNNVRTVIQQLSGGWQVNVKDPQFGATGNGSTDDTAAINAAIASVATTGGVVFFPAGIYIVSSQIIVPGGITLQGAGVDYMTSTSPPVPSRGSIIRATSGFTNASTKSMVQLGQNGDLGTQSASGYVSANARDILFDAAGITYAACSTVGRRNYTWSCGFYRGTTACLWITGQNGYHMYPIVDAVTGSGSSSSSYCIYIDGTGAAACQDTKIIGGQLREGVYGIFANGGSLGDLYIAQNHIFMGGTISNSMDIRVTPSSNMGMLSIVNNMIEATTSTQVYIRPSSSGMQAVTISGNIVFQPTAIGDNQLSVFRLDAATSSGWIAGATITGNAVHGKTSNRYKAIALLEGNVYGAVIAGNVATNTVYVFDPSGTRPDACWANSVSANTTGTAFQKSDNRGVATFSGDGSTTSFNIAHGLACHSLNPAPTYYSATAANAVAGTAGIKNVSAPTDSTNITVTFNTAPVSGTNNVQVSWEATI